LDSSAKILKKIDGGPVGLFRQLPLSSGRGGAGDLPEGDLQGGGSGNRCAWKAVAFGRRLSGPVELFWATAG